MSSRNNNFLSYYLKSFAKPGRTYDQVLKDNHCLRYGLYSFLIPAFGYTLFYIMAYKAGGAPSTFKPWLALPIENYFFYDIFLTLPAYIISFLTAGGIVHLLAISLDGKGSYEHTLALLGFGIGVASWASMIHDLTGAFLGFLGVIDMQAFEKALNSPTIWRTIWLIFYTGYFVWFPILFTKGIRRAQQLPLSKSVFLALIGFVVFQIILLVFIR